VVSTPVSETRETGQSDAPVGLAKLGSLNPDHANEKILVDPDHFQSPQGRQDSCLCDATLRDNLNSCSSINDSACKMGSNRSSECG
jgi:hypothetical protein